MEERDRLEEVFAAYRPQLGDDAEFMASLDRKIEAVEYIRQMQEAQLRHCRRMAWLAMLAGLLVGGSMTAVLLMLPVDVPAFSMAFAGLGLMLTPETSMLAGTLVLSLLCGALTMLVMHWVASAPIAGTQACGSQMALDAAGKH